MEQAALIERYTTFKDSKAVTRSETVLILTTATPGRGLASGPARLLRIHGVTNIGAERRRLNGSGHQILSRMGLLSTG
jgi:hypothetical protein